ncbi:BatA domain-containing protein [Candidatus Poribacteria bacterium]|nr:BatA domain-containing protein [Candidatus Poribacteria bacterium]
MGFLNPIFLFGILAATVPLLIHLWSRRQAKTVDFSSLMFLLVAHRQSVRRIQLKHLLILLLRMAIIILIALALARPLLKNQFSFAGARAKTSSVIILDNSYSMAYQGIEGQRFEKARVMALEVVQSLRRGDSTALILMSDIPDAVFRKLTKDLDGVKQAIRQSQVSYRSTLVPPSIEMAHEILRESNDPNKEIYLISDFGQNGWANWGRVPNQSDARIFLLPTNDTVADNTSIEEVRFSNQLIGTYLPVQLHVSVSNHSDAPSEETTLTLFIDNQKRRTVSFRAIANESVASIFTHNFESPGTHTGYLELTADRLNVDNRRYFAFDVHGQIRVLCVGDQTSYLILALNPEIQGQLSTGHTILPVSCSAEEFEDFPLEDYDVLILADLPHLSDRSRQQLQTFIRNGKSAIFFVSDGVDAENYNQFADWLPASLGQAVTWNPPLTVSEYQSDHPIFEVFKPKDFSGQYAPQFYRGVEVNPAEDARVVAQLSDGTPFLVERSVNSGETLLFNVSATQLNIASNLLVNPHFLPLLQQTVLYTKAMQSRHQRTLQVGQAYTASYRQNPGAKASIGRVGDTAELSSIAEDGSMTFNGTEIPGIYQVDVQGRDRRVRDFFAVNVDPTESDLQQVALQEAVDRVGAQMEVTSTLEDLDQTLNAYRMGKEIWGELLVIVLICMLIEGVLSNHERATPEAPALS